MQTDFLTYARNNEDWNSPITADHPVTYGDTQPVDIIACWRPSLVTKIVRQMINIKFK